MSRRIEVRIARTETGEPLSFQFSTKNGEKLTKWMYEIVGFENLDEEMISELTAANNGYDCKGLVGLIDIMFIDPSDPDATGWVIFGVSRESGKGWFAAGDSMQRASTAYERYLASRK
jgi:hypothetical protein